MYKILDLYLWLSYRFEGFTGVDDALDSKLLIENEITQLLDFNPFPDGVGASRHSKRSVGSRSGGRMDGRLHKKDRDRMNADGRFSDFYASPRAHPAFSSSTSPKHREKIDDMFEDEDGLFKFKRRLQNVSSSQLHHHHHHHHIRPDHSISRLAPSSLKKSGTKSIGLKKRKRLREEEKDFGRFSLTMNPFLDDFGDDDKATDILASSRKVRKGTKRVRKLVKKKLGKL